MKKMNKGFKLIIAFQVFILAALSGCSQKEKDFDAAGYVKSSLDAVYHDEYKEYAKFVDKAEKDAKEEVEEDFKESINQEFADYEGITEEGIAQYSDMVKQVNSLAKYEVLEAEKTEDGNYTVKVKVEPSNVYQTLEQSSSEVSQEKIDQGLEPTDSKVFASVLTESIQKSIDKNAYGKSVTVEVIVTKDESNTCGLDDSEMDKLRDALFPE